MNDETRDARANQHAHACARGEELVAYFYGEANEEEASRFRQHMTGCASCRDELSAFAGVRESLGAWRAELFNVSPALSLEETSADARARAAGDERATADASSSTSPSTPARRAGRKRSAVAALREFFALSPRWLQAASVASVLAFCALAALTLARAEVRWDAEGFALRGVPARVVRETTSAPAGDSATRARLDALAAENALIKAELETLRSRAPQTTLASAATPDVSGERVNPSRAPTPDAAARDTNRRRNARPPRTAARRTQQFARYDDEDGLPRLSDLLDEVN